MEKIINYKDKKNICLAALLVVISIFLYKNNISIFIILNKASKFIPEIIWTHFTLLGDGIIIGSLLAIIYYFNSSLALLCFISIMSSGIVTQIFKNIINFPRPPAILDIDTFILYGEAYKANSLPSGHAASAFSFYGLLFFYLTNFKIRYLFIAIASIVALSRIAVGIHWPIDVFIGSAIGFLSAKIIKSNFEKRIFNQKIISSFGFLLFIICLSGVFNYNSGYKYVIIFQSSIGIIGVLFILKYFSEKIISHYNND